MSEETPEPAPDEPPAAPIEPAQTASEAPSLPAFGRALQATDPVSLGALFTAVVAGVVGIVQTGFMWVARNDEVEAALRSEQLRACVAYRIAGENVIVHAQQLGAAGEGSDAEGAELRNEVHIYDERLSQLFYLLPVSEGSEVDDASRSAAEAYAAYASGDFEELRRLSANEEYWVQTHTMLLDQCEAIIRDVRDEHVQGR